MCSDETWILNKPGKSFMQPMTVCLPWWTAADATHNCMPGCESILAVTASCLICLCGFCFCGFRSWKSHVCWVFSFEGTFEPTAQILSREAGPICWHGMSCEFTQLEIFSKMLQNTFVFHRLAFTCLKDSLKLNVFWDLLSSGIICSIYL